MVMSSFGGKAQEKEPSKEAETALPERWEQNQKAAVMEKVRKIVSSRVIKLYHWI